MSEVISIRPFHVGTSVTYQGYCRAHFPNSLSRAGLPEVYSRRLPPLPLIQARMDRIQHALIEIRIGMAVVFRLRGSQSSRGGVVGSENHSENQLPCQQWR
jgi:hypothetical protein